MRPKARETKLRLALGGELLPPKLLDTFGYKSIPSETKLIKNTKPGLAKVTKKEKLL